MKNLILFALIALSGCGYKPLSHYANAAFGKSIYVEIVIPSDFPKLGVNTKDMINRAILTRFNLSLAPKETAETILRIEVSRIDFEMISEDSQGFANHYRANVSLRFSYKDLSGENYQMNLEASGDYASTAAMTTLAIEKAQLDAINSALQQIVDQFTSRIFYQGVVHKRKT